MHVNIDMCMYINKLYMYIYIYLYLNDSTCIYIIIYIHIHILSSFFICQSRFYAWLLHVFRAVSRRNSPRALQLSISRAKPCMSSKMSRYDWLSWATCWQKDMQTHNDMGVSKNRGTPKWMVYNGNPIRMDDLGIPPFSETPICNISCCFCMRLDSSQVAKRFTKKMLRTSVGSKSDSMETTWSYKVNQWDVRKGREKTGPLASVCMVAGKGSHKWLHGTPIYLKAGFLKSLPESSPVHAKRQLQKLTQQWERECHSSCEAFRSLKEPGFLNVFHWHQSSYLQAFWASTLIISCTVSDNISDC